MGMVKEFMLAVEEANTVMTITNFDILNIDYSSFHAVIYSKNSNDTWTKGYGIIKMPRKIDITWKNITPYLKNIRAYKNNLLTDDVVDDVMIDYTFSTVIFIDGKEFEASKRF